MAPTGNGYASSSADDWLSAQMVHRTHALAIGEATKRLADGGTRREIRDLRIVVAKAIAAIDQLEVHACYQVWWSYARSSFVLFDRALAGVEVDDHAQVQSAVAASRYLAAMASHTKVDCPRGEPGSAAPHPDTRGGSPLAVPPDPAAG